MKTNKKKDKPADSSTDQGIKEKRPSAIELIMKYDKTIILPLKPSQYLNVIHNFIEKDIRGNSSIMSSLAFDPGTIIAIGKFGVDLFNFFNNMNKPSIEDLIKELKDEIDYAIQLIKEVIDILAGLEITIKEEFRNLVINSLTAVIQTMTDNYDGWKVALNDPNKSDQAQKEISDLYVQISVSARTAITYGYAHYDSIAMASICEFALAEMLNKDMSTLTSSFKRYINYFKIATNSSISNTFGSVQAANINSMKTLEDRYIPQIVNVGYYESPQATYTRKVAIQGDIKNGFTFVEGTEEGPPPFNPRGPIYQPRVANPNISYINSVVFDSGNDIKDSYNKAHIMYVYHANNANILNDVVNSCNNYINSLETYAKANGVTL
jgi:hypothetical protein